MPVVGWEWKYGTEYGSRPRPALNSPESLYVCVCVGVSSRINFIERLEFLTCTCERDSGLNSFSPIPLLLLVMLLLSSTVATSQTFAHRQLMRTLPRVPDTRTLAIITFWGTRDSFRWDVVISGHSIGLK